MRTLLILSFVVSYSSGLLAREWEKIKIPHAKCGNGSDYFVFFSQGKINKLAIEFMGGGACWSQSTCKGPNLRTWIYPIPELPAFSHFSSDESILKDYSFIYFPYCTGDVFSGDHNANYSQKKSILHWGKKNINLSLDFLRETKLTLAYPEELIVFGSSAGGIGSLIHSKTISDHFQTVPVKNLIADSTGLHFGDDFWKKFTQDQIHDFDESFQNVSLDVDFKHGLVAPSLKKFCDQTTWNILFIQSTRDIIMSSLFGNISPENHEKNVLGPKGILQTLKDHPKCHTFISKSSGHAYMLLKPLMDSTKNLDGKDMYSEVVDFIR